jgi:pilus assembly protein CpaB
MFLRVMAVLLFLLGLGGIGLAVIALEKPAPTVQQAVVEAPQPKVQILVAARPQHAGNLLAIEDMGSKEVVTGQEPLGSFHDSVATRSALRGAMVRRSLAANEPITSLDVLNPGDRGYLAAVLGAGMRAVTVAVDSVSGTAGLIWPGDRVDMVLTQSIDEKDQPIDRRISGETVMTDLRVIAVDQQLVQGGQGSTANPTNTGNSNRTVTLEASSFDAQRIAVASRLGKLSLVVRSAADDQAAAAPDAGASPGATTTDASAPAPADQTPIAWAGDVSPALRDHVNGGAIRVHLGPGAVDDVRF